MCRNRVIAVTRKLLRRQFPVSDNPDLMHTANYLDTALLSIDESIEIPGHVTETIPEGGGSFIETAEHQPFVTFDPRNGRQAPFRLVQIRIGAGLIGHPSQLSGRAVTPAVVGAHEHRRIPEVCFADACASMCAAVEKCTNPAIAPLHDDDAVFPHI